MTTNTPNHQHPFCVISIPSAPAPIAWGHQHHHQHPLCGMQSALFSLFHSPARTCFVVAVAWEIPDPRQRRFRSLTTSTNQKNKHHPLLTCSSHECQPTPKKKKWSQTNRTRRISTDRDTKSAIRSSHRFTTRVHTDTLSHVAGVRPTTPFIV